MSSRIADRASVFAVLLIVASALSVLATGGRELAAQEKIEKGHPTGAYGDHGATSSARNLMVKTNDYGRYDPSPAFSKPRFKLIPN
ncbi:protein CASPARIAN STRIP INTEGRITY FACTOR 1-like [Oryza brachyantha]|uniref:Uncharacterized protein n=1 Tax=Oryza brachyantha TaxID=4533 RepID=J3N7R1_ORYBR|nr:protein CASPARIAN STRIP INTEGRITY FACTOR 1-like [Oryza brachyantha]